MLSLLRAKPTAPAPASPAAGQVSSRSTACGVVKAQDAVHPDYVLTVSIIRSLQNNYAFLLHERISRETAVIDPHDAGPIVALARAQGWKIQHVLNTHHHNCAGNLALKRPPELVSIPAELTPGVPPKFGSSQSRHDRVTLTSYSRQHLL